MSTSARPLAHGKDAIRAHHLAVVLAAIRSHHPVARTTLTAELALSRTSIAELTTQLSALGLISETPQRPAGGAGRPSLLLHPSDRVGSYAVNPESDVTTVGFVGLDGIVRTRRAAPTPSGASSAEVALLCAELIADIAAEIAGDARAVGIGAGIPGQVDRTTGRVVDAPRLAWRDVDFAAELAAATGLPAQSDNNARLATDVEYRMRAASGVRHLVYLFGGTGGIGAGVVSDGVLLRGAHGFAGELGHVRQSSAAARDFSGLAGTIEALVQRDALRLATGEDWSDALASQPVAGEMRDEVRDAVEALGVAIGNTVNSFDPEVVVLGGFLAPLARIDPALLAASIRSSAMPSLAERVRVEPTEGVTDAVLIGAAELWSREIEANPLAFAAPA